MSAQHVLLPIVLSDC